jgi:hypothetical protein
MLLYANKWLDYTRTIHIALKMLKNERWLFKDKKLLWSFICQMWLTVQVQMLLYADKWLDYTRTIHIALELLKNECWFLKDNKLL